MASVAVTTGSPGAPTTISGLGMIATFTVTPGTTATAGENLDLTAYFSKIYAIIPCGGDDADTAKYVPSFSYDPSTAITSSNVKFFMLVQDGAAGFLEPDNGTDLSGSTIQIIVIGAPASGV